MRVMLALALLLSMTLATAHGCTPEQCRPVVPFEPVPYVAGPVRLDAFSLRADVQDLVARTELEFRLSNPASDAAEAVLSVPLPGGATLLSFSLTAGNTTAEGTVQEVGEAQQRYEEAVEEGRDAAILEQADEHLVQVRVNVGPGEGRILRAAYAETVDSVGASRVYRAPLSRLEGAAQADLEVRVQGSAGVENLRSAGVHLAWSGSVGTATLGPQDPPQDLAVAWDEEGQQRSSLLAASDPAAGWTEYLASVCIDAPAVPRDVVFVLDHSGSMAGLKMAEGRETLAAGLATLGPLDRYGVVVFDETVTAWHASLVPATAANVAADAALAADVQADGATDLDGGLQEGLRQLAADPLPGRLPLVILFTDGLPTSGVTDHAAIIERARAANVREAPVVVVPIGLDADFTFLVDLALGSGGAYVDTGTPGDTLSDHLARLMDVLSQPVATGTGLSITGGEVGTVFPRVLPPIYADRCLEVRFQARAAGDLQVAVTGQGADGPVAFSQAFPLDGIPVVPAVRNLWGQAAVADLLSQERGGATDLRDQIVETAVELRQLTPYTAWVLVFPAEEEAEPDPDAMPGRPIASSPPPSPPSSPPTTPPGSSAGDADDGGEMDETTPGIPLGLAALALVAAALARRR